MRCINPCDSLTCFKPGFGCLSSKQEKILVVALVIIGFIAIFVGQACSLHGHTAVGNGLKYSGYLIETVSTLFIIRNCVDFFSFCKRSKKASKKKTEVKQVEKKVRQKGVESLSEIIGLAPKKKIPETKVFNYINPNHDFMALQTISGTVATLPSLCHGQFHSKEKFVLVRISQTTKTKSDVKIQNYLLLRESPLGILASADPQVRNYDIEFDASNPKDISDLETILTTNEGELRGKGKTRWKVQLLEPKKISQMVATSIIIV